MLKTQPILYKEGSLTISKIVQNMIDNNQYRSGRTATSLRVEADNFGLDIYAPDYFETLETGISPQQANKYNVSDLAKRLYGWSFDADFVFADNKKRFRFAFNAAKKQQIIGSVLYRKGGRKDVYSNEVHPLLDSINSQLSTEIMNYQIIKPENK